MSGETSKKILSFFDYKNIHIVSSMWNLIAIMIFFMCIKLFIFGVQEELIRSYFETVTIGILIFIYAFTYLCLRTTFKLYV